MSTQNARLFFRFGTYHPSQAAEDQKNKKHRECFLTALFAGPLGERHGWQRIKKYQEYF